MNINFSKVDFAFHNGSVITVNENDDVFEAVGIKNNKIVFVGSDKELKELTDENTKMVDLKGRTLMPGLIDSHYHPILSGFFGDEPESSIINLGGCRSIKDIQNKIKAAVDTKKPGEWVSMMGYD